MITLRPYQVEALDAVDAGWADFQRQLVVLPTGTGKTVLFAHAAFDHVNRTENSRVLVLAGRERLVEQARDEIQSVTGLPVGLEQASSEAHDTYEPIVAASVQTLHERRLQRWRPESVGYLVVDEAHHTCADTYTRILEHFPHAKVLGVTATPDRGDKRKLSNIFETVAYELPLRTAITDGYLAPIIARLLPLNLDWSKVKIDKGDYDQSDVDAQISPWLEQVAQAIQQYAAGRKTLVFLPLIRTSKAFVEICNNIGIRAAHVDGEMPNRHEVLADYASGRYELIANSNLLTEGYNCPSIDCIVNLRPTKIRSAYCQIVGRGTRLAPGKENLLLLDFLWQSTQHNLCSPASLFARSEDEAAHAMGSAWTKYGGGTTTETFDVLEAERDAQTEREAALAKKLRDQTRKTARTINPLEFALSIHSADLEEYEPVSTWEYGPPTEKQLALLTKMGFEARSVTCKGHASRLIDVIFKRREAGLCTPKQARFLRRLGMDPTNITFHRASEILDAYFGSRCQ